MLPATATLSIRLLRLLQWHFKYTWVSINAWTI